MVVDDREPSALVAALGEHPDVAAVAVRRIPAGDVAIGPVGVERKTSADYLSSALGPTGTDLREQVRKLRDAYEHAYVLVEGDLRDVEAVRPGVAGASVRGSMASITARLGVPVVPCGDRERLVDMAVRLARKHTEEPGRRPLSPSAVTGRDEPTAKRMYGCIDGVGPGTAKALYEAFPTVASLAAATEEELLAVEGVGERRAAAIRDALGTAV
jgi:ERCC4-type nuclease